MTDKKIFEDIATYPKTVKEKGSEIGKSLRNDFFTKIFQEYPKLKVLELIFNPTILQYSMSTIYGVVLLISFLYVPTVTSAVLIPIASFIPLINLLSFKSIMHYMEYENFEEERLIDAIVEIDEEVVKLKGTTLFSKNVKDIENDLEAKSSKELYFNDHFFRQFPKHMVGNGIAVVLPPVLIAVQSFLQSSISISSLINPSFILISSLVAISLKDIFLPVAENSRNQLKYDRLKEQLGEIKTFQLNERNINMAEFTPLEKYGIILLERELQHLKLQEAKETETTDIEDSQLPLSDTSRFSDKLKKHLESKLEEVNGYTSYEDFKRSHKLRNSVFAAWEVFKKEAKLYEPEEANTKYSSWRLKEEITKLQSNTRTI